MRNFNVCIHLHFYVEVKHGLHSRTQGSHIIGQVLAHFMSDVLTEYRLKFRTEEPMKHQLKYEWEVGNKL